MREGSLCRGGLAAKGEEESVASAGLFLGTALKSDFHMSIRCFIAVMGVTSSNQMKSSIPLGKTNLPSIESVRYIKGPPCPLISSHPASEQLKNLTGSERAQDFTFR